MKSHFLQACILGIAVCVTAVTAQAQDIVISRGLPWDNTAADPVLDARVAAAFPDGTPVSVLNDVLTRERFALVSDDRGFSTPDGDGNRFASRGVVRMIPFCSTRVALRWEQKDGQVFNMDADMHQGCV